jgi:hypothetical protein
LAAKIIYSNLYRQSHPASNGNFYNNGNNSSAISGMNKPNFDRIKRPATLIKPIITSSPSPMANANNSNNNNNDETSNAYNGGRHQQQAAYTSVKPATASVGMSKLSKQPVQNFSTKPQYSASTETEEHFPPPPVALNSQSYYQHSHTYQTSKLEITNSTNVLLILVFFT